MSEGAPHELIHLPGGARLIVAPMRQRRSAAITFMVDVGSRWETAANAGLSHFIEHIVFKGAGSHPTARSISEAIEGVGGGLNASTDKEITEFYAKVPSAELPLASGVLSEMVFAPILDEEEVVKEREVVVEELKMYEDNPQEHVATVFDEVLYPGHPLGWDVAGREETVKGFDGAACRGHLALHYRPQRLVISVAGDVVPEKAAAVIEQALAGAHAAARNGVPSGLSVPAMPTAPAVAERGPAQPVRVMAKPTEQANIVLGGYCVSYLDARRSVADVLNVILGEGMSSRLFLELREERALAYDVHSFTNKFADTGYFAMYIGCEPGRAVKAAQAAIEQLQRLATTPVEGAELAKAKAYLRGRLLLSLEGTGSMSHYLGQQLLLMGRIMTPDEILAEVDAVSPADLCALAAAILDRGLRGAAIGPLGKIEKLETVLARAA